MDDVLNRMIEIYKPEDIDWMLVGKSNGNPYTFHHIVEERHGGKREIDNGAILTKRAHQYLNLLDMQYHDYYEELNVLFLYLNRTNMPPTEDYFEEVRNVLGSARKRIPRKKGLKF